MRIFTFLATTQLKGKRQQQTKRNSHSLHFVMSLCFDFALVYDFCFVGFGLWDLIWDFVWCKIMLFFKSYRLYSSCSLEKLTSSVKKNKKEKGYSKNSKVQEGRTIKALRNMTVEKIEMELVNRMSCEIEHEAEEKFEAARHGAGHHFMKPTITLQTAYSYICNSFHKTVSGTDDISYLFSKCLETRGEKVAMQSCYDFISNIPLLKQKSAQLNQKATKLSVLRCTYQISHME
ncbi:hypothetical protein GQX74_000398 [Glossina fuscipes]|nr:hypothetical protein GQX74_000398 [Glossina fuscipes]